MTPAPHLIERMVFAVLDCLSKNAGRMRLKDLVSAIGASVPLSAHDCEPTPSGSPRWVNVIHYYSIPLSHAGFLRKDRGTWYLTPEGEAALALGSAGAYNAMKLGEGKWKAGQAVAVGESVPAEALAEDATAAVSAPAASVPALLDTESVQDLGRRSLRDAVAALNPYEFQDLVAALFRGLGYHVPFVAPRGKDGGVDVIAHSDPLGAVGASIKIQVKHTPEANVAVGVVRQLASLLHRESDCGVVVTSGGFTPEAERFAREDHRRLRLINGDELIDLWVAAYPKLSEADRRLLPVVSVCFFDSQLVQEDTGV